MTIEPENSFFYANRVFLNDENDRTEAIEYLKLWLKFFEKSLPYGAIIPEPRDHYIQYIDRPSGEIEHPFTGELQKFPGTTAIKVVVYYEGDPKNLPKLNKLRLDGIEE